jgi:hypothetical protein
MVAKVLAFGGDTHVIVERRLIEARCAPQRGDRGGADSRNRTVDPIITNDVLYQLS